MTTPAWLVATPIAHRGLHDRANGIVENTVSAADAAIARGFPIELDVQLTRDGDAVVFHDFTLDRLTAETGPVSERTGAALSAIAIAGSAADRIPTLSGFLERIAGRVPLVIEIKSRFDGNLTLTRRTVEVVSAYDGPVALKSFDPAVITALRRLAPDVPRGVVAESRYEHPEWDKLDAGTKHALANLLHFDETRPDFLSWRVGDLPCAAPFLCRRLAGLPVTTWTVRTEDDRQRAASHADQMVFEGFRPD
jgi:glycerophosphoryl diester phosphodiesterase